MSLTLSQRSWEWIKAQQDFHSTELAKQMDLSMKEVKRVIDHLTKKGAIKTINTNHKPHVYAAVRGVDFDFKRNVSGKQCQRQLIWQAMRWHGKFKIDEVVASSECTRASVLRYVNALVKYGYVKVMRPQWSPVKKQTSPKQVIYRLLLNTGHKYPVIRKNSLYDQNRKTDVKPVVKKDSSNAMD
ncbi:hypothetical protein [Neptunicella sp. SCSIO 80796]|uniref:hypothetical protein n=1 Tax=Neptunicella plasticusilytica TaxID=3117012 RepID=UPI003A4D9D08